MQRIIQINIGGSNIPMEDDAYSELRNYLQTLHHQFSHEPGKNDIIEDIEARIAELFQLSLDVNHTAITLQDVKKVTAVLGAAHEMDESDPNYKVTGLPMPITQQQHGPKRTLYRNPYDKKIAGVSSGLADYFNIDPTIIRLLFFLSSFFVLGGVITYIVCWIILPLATPEQIAATRSQKLSYESLKESLVTDLHDLKARAERMSEELKDWFNHQKW